MDTYIGTEWFNSERVRKFIITTPSGSEPGFYRQGLSFDCFKNRELKRCFGKDADPSARYGRRFSFQPKYEYDEDVARLKRSPHVAAMQDHIDFLENMEGINPLNVWEFYNEIGYDYKTQKFK